MTCKGCEARREWIKQRTDEARKRAKQLLQRLGGADDQDSRTKHDPDSAGK